MPDVVISFLDGEVLYARTPEVTFELPLVEAEVSDVDPNSERALFPVSAIRQLIVGKPVPPPDADTVERWDKAAFHFLDGQVLRASISPDVLLGRHGGVWRTLQQHDHEIRTIGIPYTSLKGVFRVRQWDSRPVKERFNRKRATTSSQLDELTRVLAERDARGGPIELPSSGRTLFHRLRGGRR
ncbi:MAG: hypothetical protein ABR564_06585 [Candidatus Dormibacteria bacterium]